MLQKLRFKKKFLTTPPDPKNNFSAGKVAVQYDSHTYAIESLVTLNKLLAEKRLKKEYDSVLRFIVDKTGVAWFAKETRPNINAPKHFQMTGDCINTAQCITAGNIKFKSKRLKVLKSINHRSGDFQPSFDSLKWFLAILILNEEKLPFKLPRKLRLQELNAEGKTIRQHKYSIALIKKWVNTFSHNADLIKKLTHQQIVDTKIVHYEV